MAGVTKPKRAIPRNLSISIAHGHAGEHKYVMCVDGEGWVGADTIPSLLTILRRKLELKESSGDWQ